MNALLLLMLAVDSAAEAPNDGSADGSNIVMLDFTASYCPPCQQMLPIVQGLESEGFPIQRVDITQQPEMLRKYQVNGIPTFLLLKDGKEVWRKVGLTAESELRSVMTQALRSSPGAAASGSNPRTAQADRSTESQSENEIEVPQRDQVEEESAQEQSNDDGTLIGFFKGLRSGTTSTRREFPTFRGQDPAAEMELNDGLKTAEAATVRVKVSGKKLQDVGTGTIIYSNTGESVILTCAHIFLGQQKDAAVQVEMFQEGKVLKFPAEVIGGDHNSDLALLKIKTTTQMPCVPLRSEPEAVTVKQELVSFGCNRGGIPSSLATTVMAINKYRGPSNITCSVDPVQGRSGGGLFTRDGHLIAVCSAADREAKTGLYMSYAAIMDLVKRSHLEYVTLSTSIGEDAATAFRNERGNKGLEASRPAVEEGSAVTKSAPPEFEVPSADGENESALTASATPRFEEKSVSAASGVTEVTVVIEPKVPGGKKRTVVIPNATPWLLELLTGEAAGSDTVSAR